MEIFVDDDTKLTHHDLHLYCIKLDKATNNCNLNDILDSIRFNQVAILVPKVACANELNRLLAESSFSLICILLGCL
eukprot:12351610-Ditylum_brightwellii.AAC.1